jgi:Protein of unknown function (DUF1353)
LRGALRLTWAVRSPLRLKKQLGGELGPEGGPARAIGIVEATAVASVLISLVQLAMQIWQKRQDRAVLLEALLEQAPDHSRLDPEKRLDIIARIADRLIPESVEASPSVPAQTPKSKQDWLKEWLGIGTRAFTPTILMPFADMDYYIVFRQIAWTPPTGPEAGLPQVIKIPKGFVTDLASIPSLFWWALPPQGRYGHAAILHDWLYWDQSTSREAADHIFDVAMDELGVAPATRKAIWASVRVFGGGPWLNNNKRREAGQSRVLKRFPDTEVTWTDWSKQPGVFA